MEEYNACPSPVFVQHPKNQKRGFVASQASNVNILNEAVGSSGPPVGYI
jgi:hypothetical protein